MHIGRAASDDEGHVYVADRFSVEPPLGVTPTLTGQGLSRLFLASYSADGKPRWARKFAITGPYSGVDDLTVGADGRLYISGRFQGASLDLGGGAMVNPSEPELTRTAAFAGAFSRDGTPLWSAVFGSKYWDAGGGIAAAADGYSAAASDVDNRVHVAWFDPAGKVLRKVSSPGTMSINLAFSTVITGGIAIDDAHNVYVAGTTSGAPTDFGGGKTAKSNFARGFVVSYSGKDGGFRWVRFVTTPIGNSFSKSGATATGVLFDGDGVMITGAFPGTIDLGGGPLVAGKTFSQYAGFVARFAAKDGSHQWSHHLGNLSHSRIRGLRRDGKGRPLATVFAAANASLAGQSLKTPGLHLVSIDPKTGSPVADRDLADLLPAKQWSKLGQTAASIAPGGGVTLYVAIGFATSFSFGQLSADLGGGTLIHLPK